MRRIVAHLIRGEAKTEHEKITRDLSEKFGTFPIHDRIPPHLTLKRWFELDDASMETLYVILDDFATSHKQSGYRLQGFGHYGEDVIYMDVKPSPETSAAVRDLMEALHGVDKMTFDEFDEMEDDLHATLVFGALKPFEFTPVWDYLNTQERIDFNMTFDNIAVLKRNEDKWVVERIWELPAA
ncbi:hypothetical protein EXS57_00630 [Candidatus Kaiserbacteria bacterium]|nr:hypothetical protein [Candidatus Kaiserbacteria bacterium]